MRVDDLVFDVGAHHGEDSAFYLALGYRVVAFEADPDHAARCRTRFADELASGRWRLIEGAIAEPGSGPIRFYRSRTNSSWGTTDGDWVERREDVSDFELVEVAPVDFGAALREHGVPHFMKIDIEGADRLCLEALRELTARPRFVSIESDKLSYREVSRELDLFEALGYSQFAVMQQARIQHQSVRIRDLAGRPVSYSFESDASGAFGDDVGPWRDRRATMLRYRGIFVLYKLLGEGGLLRSFRLGRIIAVRLPRYRGMRLPGWYDTHAMLAE
ncbi:MAG: FkbM family methyltransferase [Solirubrobacterales bacterium]